MFCHLLEADVGDVLLGGVLAVVGLGVVLVHLPVPLLIVLLLLASLVPEDALVHLLAALRAVRALPPRPVRAAPEPLLPQPGLVIPSTPGRVADSKSQ